MKRKPRQVSKDISTNKSERQKRGNRVSQTYEREWHQKSLYGVINYFKVIQDAREQYGREVHDQQSSIIIQTRVRIFFKFRVSCISSF